MNAKFFTILVIGLTCSITFADSLKVTRPPKHSFQLQISDDLSFDTFQKTWVSYKNQLTTSKAIRVGISLDLNYNRIYGSPNEIMGNLNTGAELSFNSIYISYFYFNKAIKPYYGIGPFVSSIYSREKDFFAGNLAHYDRKIEIESGLIGLFGLEWFFHKNFSLFTEYGLQGSYYYLSTLDEQNFEYFNKTFRLLDYNCLIGFSIYL